MLNILACLFCFMTTPDGVPYTEVQGTYRSIWSPNRAELSYGFAAGVTRIGGTGETVAGQFNAHALSGVHSQTWGIATEAVAQKGSKSILVGTESLVANYEPNNTAPKIGINIVWKSSGPYNINSTGLWFSSDKDTGFASGIKFDRHSLWGKQAAVIDLSDMDEEQLKNIDLIRLPNNKAIRWDGNKLYVN